MVNTAGNNSARAPGDCRENTPAGSMESTRGNDSGDSMGRARPDDNRNHNRNQLPDTQENGRGYHLPNCLPGASENILEKHSESDP